MYEITERYRFTATHRLRGLHRGNPSSSVHLHRWSVGVSLVMAQLPPAAGAIEVTGLEPLRHHIAWDLDGKYLNDIWPIAPTPAQIAEHLAEWCRANLGGFVRAVLDSITVSIEPSSATCALWREPTCRATV